MDPHQVLGVDYNATQEEIKLAYRRVAMKWHPDRNQNSAESRERFHQAAEAYRMLFERAGRDKPEGARARASSAPRDDFSNHSSSDYNDQDEDTYSGGADSQSEFADTVFWDVMLDYAIKLAQNGMSLNDITLSIGRNGCPERLASVIAIKAFDINAHYAGDSGTKTKQKGQPDQTSFQEERLDGELWRAFIGQRSYVLSGRGSVEYYLVMFRAFRKAAMHNPFNWVCLNKRLLQILNFSVVLFAALLVAVHFFPGPSQYKLLADRDLLLLPFLMLPAMLVWLLYRRLWLASLGFALLYLGTLAYYNQAMPLSPEQHITTTLLVAVVCFAPFFAIVLFGNFLYYLKSMRMLHKAKDLFTDHLDQLVWIKNRAGTSSAAAILFLLLFITSLVHYAPQYWDSSGSGESMQVARLKAERLQKVKRQVDQALELFNIAESHFNHSPPDYMKAEMAYSTAAEDGSLLAAYKLGYMYYSGQGTAQNDARAFDYFRQATRAPLAFQPHSLDITTRFLGESYNNLGIMYQAGIGTGQDLQKANQMYRRAVEFGAVTASQNLKSLYQSGSGDSRKPIAFPDFR